MKRSCFVAVVVLFAVQAVGQDVVSLGTNPDTGLEEIRVNIPGLPEDAKPLEMVLIPAGTFIMGSPPDERRRDDWEWSPHEVTITQPFCLGKYDVTQAQWQAVMGSNPARGYGVGDDFPVYNVSWDDCQTFIGRLNEMGMGTFRLPTEAEWEYACRAGTTTRFSHGDVLECDDSCGSCTEHNKYMWWCGNAGSGSHPVGEKLPNPWGLFDMHGNQSDWCSDWWEYPTNRGSQVDPQGPTSGLPRVFRGGSWGSVARFCRSAFRGPVSADYRDADIGFRLLRLYQGTGVNKWASY